MTRIRLNREERRSGAWLEVTEGTAKRLEGLVPELPVRFEPRDRVRPTLFVPWWAALGAEVSRSWPSPVARELLERLRVDDDLRGRLEAVYRLGGVPAAAALLEKVRLPEVRRR